MRIGQTSIVVFGSKLLASVLGFLATVYFARVLGAEILGYYAIVLALVGWLKLGGDIGVSSAVTKRLSEDDESSAYFTAGLTIVTGLAVGIGFLIFIFRKYVNAYVGVEAAMFVILLVLAGLFRSFVKAALNGQRLVHIAGILAPVKTGIRSAVQIGLVIFGFELAGMLFGYAVGAILVGIIGLSFLSIRLERPQIEHFRSLYEYAKYAWLGGMKSRSFNDIDVIVLGALVHPTYVGVYSVAWTIAQFLNLFGEAIKQSMFPELSHANARDRVEAVETLITDSVTYGGLVIIPGLFGGIILGDRLLRIYGEEFVRGSTVLVLLITAYLLYGYQKQFMNSLNALDRPDLAFKINIIFILSNLVLNVALIVWMGWLGAAIATAISSGIGLILSFYSLSQLVNFTVPIGEITRQVSAAMMMTAMLFVIRQFIEKTALSQYNILIVTLLVILGAGLYFSILFGISKTFRATVVANSPFPIPFYS
ncbi:flippase [Natronoglomus mannanivorans]|uniref:Flippase n=1 Tax=Natronoglomus mannanivorans TaxID=2979990 RepID=A0AAP2YVF6_9EURY|nr:flippase [Halobacteria archaeon AArc-xg1-1]